MWARITKHPVVTSTIAILLFLFTAYPVFFGDTPIGDVLKERGWALTMPSWYSSFVLILGCAVVTLQIALIRAAFRHRREAAGVSNAESKITELQKELAVIKAELAALKRTQPRLIVEPISVLRTIDRKQQPLDPQYGPGMDTRQTISAFFALLRVTNKPESRNKNAVAHHLYASISYCDSEWRELFLSPACTWVSLQPSPGNPHAVGYLLERAAPLVPYAFAHLGIATGQVSSSNTLLYAALTPTSQKCPKWIHPDFLLSGKGQNNSINVRVTIGCNGFRETHYFLLKDCGPEKGLQLEPTEKLNTMS